MKPLLKNKRYIVSIFLTFSIVFCTHIVGYADITPVSERTPQVRDAIVAEVVSVDNANDVTEAHLAAMTELDLSSLDMPSLKTGDFDGLTALTNLNLFDNDLTNLPEDVFDGLSSLTTLTLKRNRLTALPPDIFDGLTALKNLDLSNLNNLVFGEFTTLPVDVFDGLTALTTLNLQGNDFRTLPAGIFDGLTALTDLWLNANKLATLPAGVFDGLTQLEKLRLFSNDLTTLPGKIFEDLTSAETIWLDNNELSSLPVDAFDGLASIEVLFLGNNKLTSLPDGIFEGLTSLLSVGLQGNPGAPFRLSVSLEKVGTDQFKAVVVTGAPFNIVLPITVVNGGIKSLKTTVTIPTGSVESQPLTVTRTPGTTAAVTVNIGTLPGLPSSPYSHSGYTLVKSTTGLPLTVIPATANNAPVFTDGTSTTRAIAENTAPGQNIGTAIAATDADRDTLTYTLGGTDASSFRIVSTTGQLQTNAALDYEIRTSYSVTVSVSDGNGGTDSITVTINVTDVKTTPVNDPVISLGRIECVNAGGFPPQIVMVGTIRALKRVRITKLKAYINTTLIGTKNVDILLAPQGVHKYSISGFYQGHLPQNVVCDVKVEYEHKVVPPDDSGVEITLLGQRTPQVRDAIVEAADVNSADDVTAAHLAAITSLYLLRDSITTLKAGDFDGLTALTTLDLSENQLSTLPSSIFDGLAALTTLELNDNQLSTLSKDIFDGLTGLQILQLQNNRLTTLPADIFDAPSKLRELFLFGNQLTTLPADVFDGLTALTLLNLEGNRLSTLPAGIFADLTELRYLTLADNQLTTLPAGIFEGPSALWELWLDGNRFTTLPTGIFKSKSVVSGFGSLRRLYLEDNRVDPLSLTLSLEKVADGQFKAVAPAGAPFNIVLPLTVRNGSISGGASSITISKGTVESGTLTVTRTAGTTTAVTVNIGILPGLPSSHQGYELRKSTTALPLTVIPVVVNNVPVFADGATATRSIAENTASGQNIGTAIAATDADTGDTLTYTLGGTDAASFNIVSTTGQLQTNAALDYETKRAYSVTISVSDGNGGSARIAVTINITDVNENRAPVFSDGATTTRSIAENTASSQNIGTVIAATDADNDTLTYTLGGTDAAVFSIVSTTGQLQTNAALDYETKTAYSVTISVSDGNGGNASIAVTINITDVNETPANTAPVFTDGPSATRTIAENTAAGQNIGTTIAATDADNDTLTYTLGGTDAASFEIDATTGQMKTKAALDYETKVSYTVTVSVSDGSLTDTITVTINITDVNELPTSAGVCKVGDVLAPGQSCTYPGTDDAFSVNNNGIGQFLFFTGPNNLNIQNTELNNVSYTLVAKKLASGSWEIEEVANSRAAQTTNTAPTFTDGTSTTRSIAENTAASQNIGTAVAATDADSDTLTYTLGGTDAASFGIVSTTGQLQTKAALDYETKNTYSVTISVADGNGSSVSIAVTINITDLNENRAPVFSDGAATTRTVALPAGIPAADYDIGDPIIVTDPDGDGMRYTLGGTNADLFHTYASRTANGAYSLQLTTRGKALHDGTGATYSVMYTVTDASGASSSITITITVTDVGGNTNTAPTFTDGTSTTRSIAENTAASQNIGTAIAATDTDNDTLTYTLGGTDASSFSIVSTSGQLQTRAALDYETKRAYTVTVTVSDGSLTDTITVTITVTDINELPTSPGVCKVGDVLKPGQSCTYPGTDAVFSVLADGTAQWNIPNLPTWLEWVNQTSVSGSLRVSTTVNGQAYHFVAEQVGTSWEIKEIGDDRSDPQPETPEQPDDTGGTLTLSASTAPPLTETTLHEGIVTLTLNGGTYERSTWRLRDAVSVAGITGIALDTFDTERISDRKITVKLEFDGNINTDSTLTITLDAAAIADYDGAALTTQIPVTAVTESVAASTAAPLTEVTLDESVVTLTLSGRKFERYNSTIRPAVSVSGISGVTVRSFDIDRQSDTEVTVELTYDGNMNTDGTLTFTVGADAIAGYNGPALTAQVAVAASTDAPADTSGQNPDPPETPEVSDPPSEPPTVTEKPVESDYDHIEGPWLWMIAPGGNIDTDNLSKASEGVITEARIAQNGVNEGDHFNDLQWTSGRLLPTKVCGFFVCSSDNVIDVVREIGLTDKDQLSYYSAYALINISSPRHQNNVLMGVGSDDSIKVWLNGSVVYKNNASRRTTGIQNQFPVNLNAGNNLLLIKVCNHARLAFNNDWGMFFKLYLDTEDYTLSLPMADPNRQQPVTPEVTETPEQPEQPQQQPGNTGGTPTLAVSTTSALTEATLHGGVVTLTLTGGTYESSSWRIRDAVKVSGITGVTVETFDVDRVNDTQITVELTYDGNMSANGTLSISVGAGAIKDYDGTALIGQIAVSAVTESITASTASPLTEATLDESIITLTLSGRKYERWSSTIRPAVSVSGIAGVTVRSFDIDRESDTEVTVELTFNGNMTADGTLTITVGADAIAGYNGPAFTVQVSVSAGDDPVAGGQNPNPNPQQPQQPQPEQPQQPQQQPGNTGGTPTLAVSTTSALTEATLHGGVVTLTLSGGTYASFFDVADAISVSGINGVSFDDFFGIKRVSDTKVTVELEFNGNMTTDGTLTISVGADGIKDYNGTSLTGQLRVTANTESVTASTAAPLKEATLDGSVVTLTLSGAKYARSIWDIQDAVSVAGIAGVTKPWHQPRKKSDTEITIELEFNGNMNTDGTLTFTVGADAIAGYNGPALTAQVSVTADRENALLANFPNPFNPETWIPYQLAKPTEVTITIYAGNGQLVRTLALGHQPDGFYYSRSRAAYWDGKNAFGEPVASGVYFYTITAGDFTATRKMLIRK